MATTHHTVLASYNTLLQHRRKTDIAHPRANNGDVTKHRASRQCHDLSKQYPSTIKNFKAAWTNVPLLMSLEESATTSGW
jgi:hypothetical protein